MGKVEKSSQEKVGRGVKRGLFLSPFYSLDSCS